MFLVGFMLVYRGILEMKQYGEMRTMNSSQARMKPMIMYLAIGAALIFYPTMINTSLNTVFGNNNILRYSSQGGSSNPIGTNLLETVVLVLRVIGYIAFFRGWMILSQLASQQAQQGTVGRALSHLFGGIFLVNVIQTWEIIVSIFGIKGGGSIF